MKFLTITDLHCKDNSPKRRLDDYGEAILEKVKSLKQIIDDNKIKGIIIPGDVFDYPRVGVKYAGELFITFKSFNIPIWVVPGNHDIYGYNIDTLSSTLLGLMIKSGIVKLLDRENTIKFKLKDGTKVYIEGQPCTSTIDSVSSTIYDDYGIHGNVGDDYIKVLAVHGFLLDKEHYPFVSRLKPNPNDNPWCTLVEDLDVNTDVIISGHYHEQFGPIKSNKTTVLNTGAFGRTKITKNKVYYGIIEFKNKKATVSCHELVDAKKPEDIFDFTGYDSQKLIKAKELDNKDIITKAKFKKVTNIDDIVNVISKNKKIDKEIIDKTKEYISLAYKEHQAKGLSLSGYKESKDEVTLKEVHLENFLSHKKSVVKFKDGFNIIHGQSGAGKTNIFRAIAWVIDDVPKGDVILRTGANKCKVSIKLSNGYTIEKTRLKKKSGKYKVTDKDGKVYEYSTGLPPDLNEIVQMIKINLSKSTSFNPNMAKQFDGPFFLSNTPSEKAELIGSLIGIEPLDIVISNTKSEIFNNNKTIKILQEQQLEIEDTLSNFPNTDKLTEDVKDLEKLYVKLKKISTTIDTVDKLYERRIKVLNTINSLNSFLDKTPNIDNIQNDIEILKLKSDKYNNLKKLNESFINATDNVCSYEKLTHGLEGVDDMLVEVNKLKNTSDKIETINQYTKRYNKLKDVINNNEIFINSNLLEDISKNIIKLKEIHSKGSNIASIYKQSSSIKKKINKEQKIFDETESLLAKSKSNIESYIKENNICPLCSQTIDINMIIK